MTTRSGGLNCDHPITSMQSLEGTPFTECLSCHTIFENAERVEGTPHFNGAIICERVDHNGIMSRTFDERSQQYQIKEAKRIDGGYQIGTVESTVFILTDDRNPKKIEPKVGDRLTLFTFQWSIIKGVYLNGVKVFHFTDNEQRLEDLEAAIERNREKARDFYESRGGLDSDYDSLPPAFKKRIDKYRTNNPSFRSDFEGYEMICCTDAVKVADHLRPTMDERLKLDPDRLFEWAYEDTSDKLAEFAAAVDPEPTEEFLRKLVAWKVVSDFNSLPYQEQEKVMSDQHSGNTHSMALLLARLYLAGSDDDIVRLHGAMAPIVGSAAYGDIPRED